MAKYEALGRTGRTVAARLGPGTDVMEGIVDLCRRHKIRAAQIATIIGGVNRAKVEVARPSDESPVGVVAKEIILDKPHAILGGQGMVCVNDKGEIEPHLHITFVNEHGQALGGHLEMGTAPVTTTADIILIEVLDVEFGRGWDDEVKTVLFFPRQKGQAARPAAEQ